MEEYKKSEKWIEEQIVKDTKALGGTALKFASSTQTGYPDRMILLPHGIFFWVEVKSKGEKPRKLQEIRKKELEDLGHTVYVVDDIEQWGGIITKRILWLCQLYPKEVFLTPKGEAYNGIYKKYNKTSLNDDKHERVSLRELPLG